MSKPKPNRREPLTPGKYFEIHDGKIVKLKADGVILEEDLELGFDEPGMITMMGTIKFDGPVVLSVKKWLVYVEHKGKACIVTSLYSYQCYIEGVSKSEIFRYDNYHGDTPHDGHKVPHHVHRYDPPGKQLAGYPRELEEETRPLFDEIIKEAAAENKKYKAAGGKKGSRIGDEKGGRRKR